MFSIFDNSTGQRVSADAYTTADEANHDYHMNAGSTHVGVIPDAYEQDAARRSEVHAEFWDREPLTSWQEFILCRELNCGVEQKSRRMEANHG